MRVSVPITLVMPDYGVIFAESAHAADFRMAVQSDPFHKLIYVLDGQVDYREEGGLSIGSAGAGALLIVPRDVRHQLVDKKPSIVLILCLGRQFLDQDPELNRLWLGLARIARRKMQLSRPTRQRLEGMWQWAMVEKGSARPGNIAAIRAIAAQTLVLLARLPVEGGGATAAERVAAVTREIDETFFDPWDLDRAAARAGVSRRRFTDLFRAAAGRTFWDFLNERRLAHAAHLLRTGENSLIGVAFSCGYNDLSHFYRLFRRRYQSPPRAWLLGQAKE
jgi:AraC family L-rhamnose operon regulatory protein RhaS